jgi:hypothetical protein
MSIVTPDLSIAEEGWRQMSQHHILSVHTFPHQWFVRASDHVSGEIDDVGALRRLAPGDRLSFLAPPEPFSP